MGLRCSSKAIAMPAFCKVGVSCRLFVTAAVISFAVPSAYAEPDDDPYLPGLIARYRDAKTIALRIDRQPSFDWGGAAPDARLTSGAFQVSWHGRLNVETRGEHRFYIHGCGEVELKVGGREVIKKQPVQRSWCESPPIELAADLTPVDLSFRRTGDDAAISLFWSGPNFGLEPMPQRSARAK